MVLSAVFLFFDHGVLNEERAFLYPQTGLFRRFLPDFGCYSVHILHCFHLFRRWFRSDKWSDYVNKRLGEMPLIVLNTLVMARFISVNHHYTAL